MLHSLDPIPCEADLADLVFSESDTYPSGLRGMACFVGLFHIWCRATSVGANPLPEMVDSLSGQGGAPDLAPACESYFILTQACLERRLVPSRGDLMILSPDEAALVEMLRYASNPGAEGANSALSQGLTGALRWAAFAVVRSFRRGGDDGAMGFLLLPQDEDEIGLVDGPVDGRVSDG